MKLNVVYDGWRDELRVVNADTGEELEGVLAVAFDWDEDRGGGRAGRGRITLRLAANAVVLNGTET